MQSQNQITARLLSRLWTAYCERVSYADTYRRLVEEKGGVAVNDHCAFRTFNTNIGAQKAGIAAITEVLEALGYERISFYAFPSKHLKSLHYQHPTDASFPKFFVTQLEITELSQEAQTLIKEAVGNAEDLLAGEPRVLLNKLAKEKQLEETEATLLVNALVGFFARPWQPVKKTTVLRLNQESQFAAWTLLHGNSVNHFTAYINHQNVAEWQDIEATIEGLKAAGIPMKDGIEGLKDSKLRQSSTQAVDEDCPVVEADGTAGTLRWSYAYYELAERNYVVENNEKVWFDGFLGDQATHLFEMTKR